MISTDYQKLRLLYAQNNFVYLIISIIARKISAQPLCVYKRSQKNGKQSSDIETSHPVNNIIARPNTVEDYQLFMSHLVGETVLMGNAITFRDPSIDQMLTFPYESVQQEQLPDGSIKYRIIGKNFGLRNNLSFKQKDIITTRLPSLMSHSEGLSPFIPGYKDVEFINLSKDYLSDNFKEGTTSDLVYTMEKGAVSTEAERFIKTVIAMTTGPQNNRKPFLAPPGVSIDRIRQALADPELKHHVKDAKLDLIALLAIPPHELGLQDAGSLGSEETKESLKNFWQSTLIPLQKQIAGSFSKHFFGPKEPYFLAFDNSGVACLRDDELKKSEIANKMIPFFTRNEIREKVYNAEPITGGDVFISQSPLAVASNQPLIEPKNEESKKTLVTKSMRLKEDLSKADWVNSKLKLELKMLDILSKKYLINAHEILSSIVKSFLSKLPIKKSMSDLDLDDFAKYLEMAIEGGQESWVSSNISIVKDASDLAYDLHLKNPGLSNEPAIPRLRQKLSNGRRATLAARQLTSFVQVTQTLTNDILDTVANGLEEAKTIDEIADDIEAYNLAQIIPNRSKVIARTEVLGAMSHGQEAAMEDYEKITGRRLEKIWLTHKDGRERQSHENLDGERVWKDGVFSNGLRFPRDPNGPPEETIQCRCSWIIVEEGKNV